MRRGGEAEGKVWRIQEQIGGWFNYLPGPIPSLAPTPGVDKLAEPVIFSLSRTSIGIRCQIDYTMSHIL